MKKITFWKGMRAGLVMALAVAMVFGLLSQPHAQASAVNFRLRQDIAVDHSEFVDDSVAFRLPEHIRRSEEISVIITLDEITLMDAYQGTDQAMSLAEFVSTGDAQAIRADIRERKAQILFSFMA
jgi:hypothetical protein